MGKFVEYLCSMHADVVAAAAKDDGSAATGDTCVTSVAQAKRPWFNEPRFATSKRGRATVRRLAFLNRLSGLATLAISVGLIFEPFSKDDFLDSLIFQLTTIQCYTGLMFFSLMIWYSMDFEDSAVISYGGGADDSNPVEWDHGENERWSASDELIPIRGARRRSGMADAHNQLARKSEVSSRDLVTSSRPSGRGTAPLHLRFLVSLKEIWMVQLLLVFGVYWAGMHAPDRYYPLTGRGQLLYSRGGAR